MPGMNSGLNPADPTLVAAFRSALLHQGAIAVIILAFLWLLWATARTWRMSTPAAKQEDSASSGSASTGSASTGSASTGSASTGSGTRARWAWLGGGAWEAPGRRLLRVGFGLIWILDGILQAQPKMAGGLAAQVIEPTAASSPAWVQHVVNWGGTAWSYHPIQAGAASVWIQVGLGIWLLVAAHGPWSRLRRPGRRGLGPGGVGVRRVVRRDLRARAELADRGARRGAALRGGRSAGRAAGRRLAQPARNWARLLLAGLGLFYLGMAVLQAWPGRGYWQGTSHGTPGTLASMVQGMAATPQPHVLSALVADFGAFAASNGFAVNLGS